MKHFHETQAEFMDLCELPRYSVREVIANNILANPLFLHHVRLWKNLIREEVLTELFQTLQQLDPLLPNVINDVNERIKLVTKIADDIVDSVYCIDGLSNLFGLPRETIFNEIHKTNMAKAVKLPSGKFIIKRRADGKIIKPEGWQPPNVQSIIEAYTEIP